MNKNRRQRRQEGLFKLKEEKNNHYGVRLGLLGTVFTITLITIIYGIIKIIEQFL